MSLEYRISAVDQFSGVFKDAEKGLDNLSKTGDNLKNFGGKLTKNVTAPVLALAGGAIIAGSKFEAEMSKVEAISGATGKDLDSLKNAAMEMGRTTQFSASESAEALSFMSLAGWTAEQSVAALPGVLDLAAAGALDLGRASDIVTDMMSVFSLEASEAGRASDVFAKAQATSNTTVDQLGEALKKAGPTVAAAGGSLEEASAILGVFANNGIKGSEAGTILDAMYADLRQSAEDGAIAIGDSSVALYDAEGNMRSMIDIMADLEKATDGMTDIQRDQAMASIFQRRSMRGANILLEEGTDAAYALMEGLYEADGAAGQMAETMMDNLQGSFKEMMSALEGLAISFYELLQPALQIAIDFITDLIRWFDGLDESTQMIIIAVAGFAAALGPLLMAIGIGLKLLPLLGAAIGAIFSPVGLIIAAIAGLVAAFIYLWNTSDTFRENITAAFEFVREKVMAAIGAVRDFVQEQLEVIFAFWDEHGAMVMQAVENVFNVIKAVVSFVMPFIEALISMIWGNIKGVFSGAIDFILGIVQFFAALFTGNWSEMGEAVKRIVSGFLTAVWNLFQLMLYGRVFKIVTGLGGRLLSYLGNLGKSFFNSGKGLIQQLINGIKNMATKAVQAVKDVAQKVRNLLPFSPAKDGPLADLNKLDFAGPITHSIDAGIPDVQRTMMHMLGMPDVNAGPARIDRGSSGGNSGGYKRANIIIEMDRRKLAEIIGEELVDEIRMRQAMVN